MKFYDLEEERKGLLKEIDNLREQALENIKKSKRLMKEGRLDRLAEINKDIDEIGNKLVEIKKRHSEILKRQNENKGILE